MTMSSPAARNQHGVVSGIGNQHTDALGDLLGLGSRVSDITLGDADAVGLEELSGAVLVDGEVASLLKSGSVLNWQSC
jgi:hypothetical protein